MKRRGSLRDVGFYLLIAVILIMTIYALRGFDADDGISYADIHTLLDRQQVAEVVVKDDNTLILTLREPWNGQARLEYKLRDFDKFYEEFNDTLVAQKQAGILVDYDYPAGFVAPWWLSLVPWVVIIIVFFMLWYFMFLRQAGGGGGGVDKTARFGKARTQGLGHVDDRNARFKFLDASVFESDMDHR